ncbi:unnamed protein product [Prunus armeniaca]
MPTSGMFDVFAEPSAQAFSFRFHRSPPSLPSSFHPVPLFTCFLAFFSFDLKINLYLKAVRTGNAAVGVRGTDTIVLGVKKKSTASSRTPGPSLSLKQCFSVLLSNRLKMRLGSGLGCKKKTE